MKSKEEKLIALKVLLSVQDLTEISQQSKTFKANGVVVKNDNKQRKGFSTEIKTPFVKEVSWLLFQLQYVFQDSLDDFLILCNGLSLKISGFKNTKEITDYLLKKSGKLLS